MAQGEIEMHTNNQVQEKLRSIGKYKFENRAPMDLGAERELKELHRLIGEDGEPYAIYEGQVSVKTGKPDGYGALISMEGDFYEGALL